MKAAFRTLGCKVNQYETEAMKEQFRKAGYEIAGEEELADVYVINTCTVTQLADRKSRQFIRRAIRMNPEALVAVTGCYSEIRPEEVRGIEGVDIITGTGDKEDLPRLVLEMMAERGKADLPEVLPERGFAVTAMEGRTRAYIKVEDGCDRFCSYCIIPHARGPVRSRPMEKVLEEVEGILAAGYREIVLTGINTALYGKDLGLDGIAELIAGIDRLPGDFRIRLSSLEPAVIDRAYVEKLFAFDKLCHHLHLSAQSGSDSVIRRMNRHYTREDYLEIVKTLRRFDPGYGITTDIICGFPGETEEDFQDSVRLAEEAGFLKVHVFPYSRRTGTPAAAAKDQVRDGIRTERTAIMARAGEEASARFLDQQAGTVRRFLAEREESFPNDLKGPVFSGYTDNYIKTFVTGADIRGNEFREVRLLRRYRDGMLAEATDRRNENG